MARRPDYQRDGISLYLGDCMEILPDLEGIDITVTSPPYNTLPDKHTPSGLHADRKSGVNKWIEKAAKGYADQMPELDYQAWIQAVVTACAKQSQGLVWINHKVRYRDGEGVHPLRFISQPFWCEVIWDRGGSMALNCKKFAPSHEALWAFGRPHYWNDQQNTLMSVWKISADSGKDEHPCAYPIEIARRPIAASCPPGGLVFDPFTGSGTTAVASIQSACRFVGTEKDERYFAIAVNRINRALDADRDSLWSAKELAKESQLPLFD